MTNNGGVLTLTEEGGADYTLREDATSVWVQVGNLAVYIVRADEGVSVDIYPAGREMEDPLVSTWVLYDEAEEDNEDDE